MIRSIGFAAAFGMMAAAAWAQDAPPDCSNATEEQLANMAQQEMNFCAEQDWMDMDAVLNLAYKEAMARMKSFDADLPKSERGAEENLRNAQRAWVTFRDAACAAEGYAWHGGSAEPMIIYGCRARLTRQRNDDLAQMTAE